MDQPPDDVELGDRLTQEEIEEAFDTGFGYRISGINPRRDDQNRRYVLVFANEDGPYDDAVTRGRFEYLGEGLTGDQSETAPGNSTLIDAIDDDIPVHFFYREADDDTWSYHGLVDVLSYTVDERDGRDVLVFDMQHRRPEQSTNSPDWTTAVRRELAHYREQHGASRVTIDAFYDHALDRLAAQFPDNQHVRAKVRQTLQRLRDRDEIAFVDSDGTYRLTDLECDRERFATPRENADSIPPDSDAAPELTDAEAQFTETRRRARDSTFAEAVKSAYEQTCVVCGRSRETPAGDPEVEAAHIFPKADGGVDDVRNGITLCKLHHWAFDTGWLAITDDYELVVRDVPEREGYYEFKQLEGDSLVLPDGVAPHPTFLQAHRELHGF